MYLWDTICNSFSFRYVYYSDNAIHTYIGNIRNTIHMYSGITSGRVLDGELLYTKISMKQSVGSLLNNLYANANKLTSRIFVQYTYICNTIHMYSGITSGRVLNGELLYTKILEVNLFAFAYRLFRRDQKQKTKKKKTFTLQQIS